MAKDRGFYINEGVGGSSGPTLAVPSSSVASPTKRLFHSESGEGEGQEINE